MQSESDNSVTPVQHTETGDEQLRAIAYSMDALIPGLYFWSGAIKIRIGGSLPEPTYPGTIHSKAGIALVLPNYRIYSTYQGSYDP
ncbi:MAG: hypothetical protein IGS54_01815 [Elainella sp. C42_A2020_010]|nr:hypothetical protein [Elainella sp. C42_A2020_010]RNJ66230.1 MAG: hypothetical protein EDM05_26950 [Leptolyngbya sp. IPPAS B-1204]